MAISMKLCKFFIDKSNKEFLLTTEIAECNINNGNFPMSKRPPCNGYHDCSKLCPKFSKFSVDSEITGLPQNLLSIKAFVHPAAVMMVLTDNFAVFAADVDASCSGTMCMENISVNSCFVQNCFQPPCIGINCHRLMWLLVAYQQLSVVASKGLRFCQE
jgi:hypothetical protein